MRHLYAPPSSPARENDRRAGTIRAIPDARARVIYAVPYVINQRANHPRLNRLCVTKTTKGDYRARRAVDGARRGSRRGGYRCEMFPWGVPPPEKQDRFSSSPFARLVYESSNAGSPSNRTICYSSFVTRAIGRPGYTYYPVSVLIRRNVASGIARDSENLNSRKRKNSRKSFEGKQRDFSRVIALRENRWLIILTR